MTDANKKEKSDGKIINTYKREEVEIANEIEQENIQLKELLQIFKRVKILEHEDENGRIDVHEGYAYNIDGHPYDIAHAIAAMLFEIEKDASSDGDNLLYIINTTYQGLKGGTK